ncbi:hypothetical protein JCM11491_006391 [Sporobolomyces phaffii]
MVDATTAPSTPARSSPGSSSPAHSSSASAPASTPATSTEKPKANSSSKPVPRPDADEMEPDSSSDVEVMELDPDYAETKKDAKKRKGESSLRASRDASDPSSAASSSKPAAKKSKTSAAKSTSAKDAGPQAAIIDVSNDLIGFRNGRLEHKQKAGPKSELAPSYMIGRALLMKWAVGHFTSSAEKLPEIPAEHHGAIAKDIHEASQLPGGLARNVRNSLADSILVNMSVDEDSQDAADQEVEDDKAKKDKILDRIDVDSLKQTIESLAVRTNYGLAVEDLNDGQLPGGLSAIPASLQFWVWEVQDSTLLSPELVSKYEKRRAERVEIKRSVLELFGTLSEEDQVALLSSKKGSDKGATATKDVKGKGKASARVEGKGKGKAKSNGAEGGETSGADEKSEQTKDGKPKVARKKKELTEEEKAEKEEKLRIKAEKEAEKEEKRKEREAKKAAKAEKDALEEEKKAQKRKEKEEKRQADEKKQAALKSQKNLMSSFFGKTSPNPSSSASPSAGTSKSAIAAPSSASKSGPSNSPAPLDKGKPSGDFAKVFHPFTIRPGVKVAPVNRFNKGGKKNATVEIDSVDSLTLKDSLAAFVSSVPKRRIPPYNPYPCPPFAVRQLVVGINDSTLTSQDASGFYEILKDRQKVPVKLLKFREDVRPGYVGTWSKTSKVVTPRTPFGRDGALLNYEMDSECEWEEEPDDPDAENVGSDGEMSHDENDDDDAGSEADSWLADDDEIEYEAGYEADGDIVMMDADARRKPIGGGDHGDDDDDDVIVVEGEKEKKERLRKKKKMEEKQKKKKAAEPLLPFVKGPVWEDVASLGNGSSTTEPAFVSFKTRFLNDCSFGINPLTYTSTPPQVPRAPAVAGPVPVATSSSAGKGKENIALAASTTAPSTASTPADDSKDGGKKSNSRSKPFPESLVARFLVDINGSDKPKGVVIDTFVTKINDEAPSTVTKTACEKKWKELGIQKLKGKVFVPDALLLQHGVRV